MWWSTAIGESSPRTAGNTSRKAPGASAPRTLLIRVCQNFTATGLSHTVPPSTSSVVLASIQFSGWNVTSGPLPAIICWYHTALVMPQTSASNSPRNRGESFSCQAL